jgi:hypothetical protein
VRAPALSQFYHRSATRDPQKCAGVAHFWLPARAKLNLQRLGKKLPPLYVNAGVAVRIHKNASGGNKNFESAGSCGFGTTYGLLLFCDLQKVFFFNCAPFFLLQKMTTFSAYHHHQHHSI